MSKARARFLTAGTVCAFLTLLIFPGHSQSREQPADSTTAAKAFSDAEALRAQWNAEAWRQAISKYNEALAYWKSIHNLQEEARTLRSIGDAYKALSENQKALPSYLEALSLSGRVNDPQLQVQILNELGSLYCSFVNHRECLAYGVRALKLSQAIGSRGEEAAALNNIGGAHYASGDLRGSTDYYNQALAIWRQLKDSRGEAQTLLNLGYSFSDLSETGNAENSYREALNLWRALRNPVGAANTLAVLGHLNSKLGEKQKALDFYQSASALIKNVGDEVLEGSIYNGMGFVYEELNQHEKALSCYEQALSHFNKSGSEDGQGGALLKIGEIYYQMLQGQKAITYFQQALRVFRGLGNPRMQAFALRNLGRASASLSNADLATNYYKQALSLNRQHEDRRGEAYILVDMGQACELSGARAQALNYYNEALSLNHETADLFGESATLYNIAHLERDLGKLDDAHAFSERALKIIESLRTKVVSSDLRTSYFGAAHRQYELHVDILMQLQKQNPERSFHVSALEASERGRSRSFIDTLAEAHADIREGVDPTLLERERALQGQIDSKAERQTILHSGNHTKPEADALAAEILKLTTEYEEVRAQIKSSSPRYAALTQPQPLSLPEIQKRLLDDNTLLIEYMLGDERSYLWAVTRTEVSSYELAGRAEIEKAAHRYYELLTAKQPRPGETFQDRQDRAQQAEGQLAGETEVLSKLLLAPVANKLGTKRLLIVADGALQYIPFQALTVPAGANDSTAKTQDGEPRLLVQDHEIVNEPSASTLALVLNESANRTPATRSVAILADPVFEIEDARLKSNGAGSTVVASASPNGEVTSALRDVGVAGDQIPRLLSSREEAEAVMAVVPWHTGFKAIDFEANRATAMGADLGKYRIVHFATHALLDNERPELSGIVLSLFDRKGQRQDGFLRLHDIYNLKLPVDLVVLSACQTGLGKDVKGEGLIGLTRGFMYAGASGVVASLWKVDDDATAELMKHFYAAMFEKGLSPAAALRDAQLAMRQQKRWHHPYYWAGFVIQGQYNGRESMKRSWTVQRLVVLAGIGVCLSLAIILVLRRRRRRRLV